MSKQLGDAALAMISVRFQSLIGGGGGIRNYRYCTCRTTREAIGRYRVIHHLRVATYLLTPNHSLWQQGDHRSLGPAYCPL